MPALSDLKAFDLCPERGFLPGEDPLASLPAAFAPWQELADELPRLLPTGRLRRLVAELPVLDPAPLASDAQARAAMRALSFLAHAYVWGGPRPADALPAPLAVPWCALAQRLGRPPVLSYASYALDNWRRLDPEGPVALGNIALLQNFLGGLDEDWFIGVHIDIEARAAPVLREVGPLADAVRRGDETDVCERLFRVASGIETLVHVLERMPEFCDPYIYYRRVRPFIHGWANQPALPRGLVYEGVDELGGAPQRLRGETGAQSGIVPALDALLGVQHADDPLRAYLQEMRDYMPPGHRAFVEAIKAAPALRPFVRARAPGHGELGLAYDECLHWLEAFRSTHLDYAARFIHRQSQTGEANPNQVGTGGTPFMPYLRKHRDETAAHRLALEVSPKAGK